MILEHNKVVGSLKRHTEEVALPNGRMVGSTGHFLTRGYLVNQMEAADLIPFHGSSFELRYERPHPNTPQPQDFTNLVGVIPGRNRTLPPILVGAHYDSVIAAPSVDDNATSVAMNLVLTEEYRQRPLDRDLIIAYFDSEEPPFFLGESMGSRRFCEDYCQDLKFAAVIVSDLIGHDFHPSDLGLPSFLGTVMPHLRKLVCVMGAESSPVFPLIVSAAAGRAKGIRVFHLLHRYVSNMSDHAAFAKAGHPFLFLSCGQGRHYHSPQDTLEWINFGKLGRITQYVADLIDQINGTPSTQAQPLDDQELFDLEMEMLREALGMTLPMALKHFKQKLPTSREALDGMLSHSLQAAIR